MMFGGAHAQSSRRWSCWASLRFQVWSSLLKKPLLKQSVVERETIMAHLTLREWGKQREQEGWSTQTAGCSWTGRTSASWNISNNQSKVGKSWWLDKWDIVSNQRHFNVLLPPYDKVVCDVNKGIFTAGVIHFMPKSFNQAISAKLSPLSIKLAELKNSKIWVHSENLSRRDVTFEVKHLLYNISFSTVSNTLTIHLYHMKQAWKYLQTWTSASVLTL